MNKSLLVSACSFAALLVGASGCKPTPSKEDAPPAPKVMASIRPAESSFTARATAPGAMSALPKLGPAPAWKLKDLAGNIVDSEELKGKVVVVDFWATWCPPCREEIPGYIALQKKYGADGFVIVGVSIDQAGPEVVKTFAAKMKMNYPLVMADEDVATAFGGVQAIPTTFLIDRSGQIRDRKEGSEETAEYEKKISAVLGEKA